MTHASWNNERGRPSGPGHDNERLEYLGDAVLELVVGEYLFKRFPGYDEGQLTQLRAALVNTVTLARLAERLELGEALFVGKGAAKTGARRLPSLLANAFEAMIGSIFLDQGYRVATRVFLQNIGDLAEWSDENFKGRLQEVAQERTGTTPTYRVSAVGGPGHKREYTADAVVGGEVVGNGRGTTKQAAEQAAARAALQTLAKQPKRKAKTAAAAAGPVTRAARAARVAEEKTRQETPRVRRRVAEVAADRSAAGRRERSPREVREAEGAAAGLGSIGAAEAPRRRGLLAALRSAAEALVGRVAPEPTPTPAPAPPAERPPAPRRRPAGQASGGGTTGTRRGGGRSTAAPQPGEPGQQRRSRGGRAASPGTPGEGASSRPPRARSGGRAAAGGTARTSSTATREPAAEGPDGEARRSRRGRRGGRGRRRSGGAAETPQP